jgi:glucuronate isomerase
MALLHPDRLFPADPATRDIARRLYESVRDLPIVSPHGHTEARWFAENAPFPDPATLFIQPDHYVFRMLYSQGIALDKLNIGKSPIVDPRGVWRIFAEHYYLFRGTPTRLWLDYAFETLFDLHELLCAQNADLYFDTIQQALQRLEFRPRALYDRFRIDVLATTNSPLDPLTHHQALRGYAWKGRILPTFRPDPVVDPDFDGFVTNVASLGEMTGEDTSTWSGYLGALRETRRRFAALGCTATDHGHPTAATANLTRNTIIQLFARVISGKATAAQKEQFRAHMLTEMAAMSMEDGLVMQIHPGSSRNHNRHVYENYGRDMGADIPTAINYVDALKPLLDRFGNESRLTVILFTLDESTYSRELAPLAGHYPCLRLGPPWWFFDSPEGMLRFRERTTETAGFYNTAGFNDDTRAFLSIPGRHDVARRMDAHYLARLVSEHRLSEGDAGEVILDLTDRLVRKAYRLEEHGVK